MLQFMNADSNGTEDLSLDDLSVIIISVECIEQSNRSMGLIEGREARKLSSSYIIVTFAIERTNLQHYDTNENDLEEDVRQILEEHKDTYVEGLTTASLTLDIDFFNDVTELEVMAVAPSTKPSHIPSISPAPSMSHQPSEAGTGIYIGDIAAVASAAGEYE